MKAIEEITEAFLERLIDKGFLSEFAKNKFRHELDSDIKSLLEKREKEAYDKGYQDAIKDEYPEYQNPKK